MLVHAAHVLRHPLSAISIIKITDWLTLTRAHCKETFSFSSTQCCLQYSETHRCGSIKFLSNHKHLCSTALPFSPIRCCWFLAQPQTSQTTKSTNHKMFNVSSLFRCEPPCILKIIRKNCKKNQKKNQIIQLEHDVLHQSCVTVHWKEKSF